MSLPKREVGQIWRWTDLDEDDSDNQRVERHEIVKIENGVTFLKYLNEGLNGGVFEYDEWESEAVYWSLEIEGDLIGEIPDEKGTIEI